MACYKTYILNKLKLKYININLVLKEFLITDISLLILNQWILISDVIIDDYISHTLSIYDGWDYPLFNYNEYIEFVEFNNDLLFFLNPHLSISFLDSLIATRPNTLVLEQHINNILKTNSCWYMTIINQQSYIIEKNRNRFDQEEHYKNQLAKPFILLPYKNKNVYMNINITWY